MHMPFCKTHLMHNANKNKKGYYNFPANCQFKYIFLELQTQATQRLSSLNTAIN